MTIDTAVTPRNDFTLDDRYLQNEGPIFLTGIQALVRTVRDRALLDRERGHISSSFVSGYEGSPLGRYDLEFTRRLRFMTDLDVVFKPAVNEELAATSVLGTQLAGQVGTLRTHGVTGYWYGKAPGLDRAADAVRHGNLIGTDPSGGVVAIVGDDPGAKSSSVPCASESQLASLLVPTLYPADVQDLLDMALHAPFMSRYSGLWSALKVVTNVADSAGSAVVGGGRVAPLLPEVPTSGPGLWKPTANLFAPNLIDMEQNLFEIRLPRAIEYARLNGFDKVVISGSQDRVGLVAAGKTYLDLREALSRLGLAERDLNKAGIRVLKLDMVYPVDEQVVREFSRGLREVIVIEEKRPFLEDAIRAILQRQTDGPVVLGKQDPDGAPFIPVFGELDPMIIADKLGRRFVNRYEIEVADRPTSTRPVISLPLLSRTPYFCSGCPHNSSTKVAPGTIVGGGIGCHAMVLLMDESTPTGNVLGLTQMGGEGAQWIGMEPFLDKNHYVQNLGDGTFTHSGSLALRAAVASGVDMTYKLLFNGTVAMTGGQDAVGAFSLKRLVELLHAEGVEKIVVTTEDLERVRRQRLPRNVAVRHRDDLIAVQEELAAVKGVTVLIHDQECAAEKRRKRKRGTLPTPSRKVVINERVCEGCGDCGAKSNCLSVRPVETEFGRKTQIHQSSCNVDYACLKGDCPSFVTVEPGAAASVAPPEPLNADSCVEPDQIFDASDFSMRIMGIGGTGIVTLSQVLATAGFLDGAAVRSLDQTGLAQKGGAVVSDVRLSAASGERAAKVTEGQCSLYLACDSLVATDAVNLGVTSPNRTVSVVSTAEVPTGAMVVDTGVSYPEIERLRSVFDRSSSRTIFVNPAEIAARLFGDEQYANFVLVGAAYQAGALPISAGSIERAIELNGVEVDSNIQAFRRGRQAIADPEALETELYGDTAGTPSKPSPSSVDELIRSRHAELVRFQNTKYAASYEEFVRRVQEAEHRVDPTSDDFTSAVARNLFKLMAYKDEYEVARLSFDPEFEAKLEAEFGKGAKRYLQLHPPVLRALGMKRKISLGRWSDPFMKALARMKWLRFTPFDPFGYAKLRRIERELVGEYRTSIERTLQHLSPATLSTAVQIAELPDVIRGYEEIKLGNVSTYRSQVELLIHQLEGEHAAQAAQAAGGHR
ncbi:indolepyruvate ferredoxin oxidoreductase family protein [Nocardia sp. R7R-8]|uniref:indolepyruvate ferredoxin oxidoreductase family protein n=1 Tax=Nocardia sp. R7R-8 TaxID=3459304 RepID=UPI00403D87E6